MTPGRMQAATLISPGSRDAVTASRCPHGVPGGMSKKPVLAMFVVAAIAIGLLVVLVIGLNRVNEDGRENDGHGLHRAGYPAG
jgi:hypothetical protein